MPKIPPGVRWGFVCLFISGVCDLRLCVVFVSRDAHDMGCVSDGGDEIGVRSGLEQGLICSQNGVDGVVGDDRANWQSLNDVAEKMAWKMWNVFVWLSGSRSVLRRCGGDGDSGKWC